TSTPDNSAVHVSVSPNPANKFATVTIDASASVGSYNWFEFDFGDGTAHVQQAGASTTHQYDVVNFQDTTYTVKVTGQRASGNPVVGTANLLVKDLPPQVTAIDPGSDKKGVIGEWIKVAGANFYSTPTITVDGQTAAHVEVIDTANLRFRVPPASRAGTRDVFFTFTGYAPQKMTLDVKRYAVATSARYGNVYLMDVDQNEAVTDTTLRLPVTNASTVKISPDGSTAYVTDGRFNFLSTGTITILDLTSNSGPAVVGSIQAGNGPLFDIEPAANAPLLVAGDAFGIYLFDVSDPLHPVQKEYDSILFAGDPVNDVGAADIAVTPDGSKIAVLNALDSEARLFTQTNFHVTNANTPKRVSVGPKTQKAAISDDGNTLYVLGGGGEGAVPMDLSDPRAANITAIDIHDGTLASAPVMAGPYLLSDMNATNVIAPVPFDLAISRSNAHNVYVTTLDQGFTTLFNDLSNLVNNPSIANLITLVNFLATGGLNFGDTISVLNADGAGRSLGTPYQSTLTAPTAADLLFNDHVMLQSSFRIWYDSSADNGNGSLVFQTGATAVNSFNHTSTYMPFETEDLSFGAVLGLFAPPFSFGDCAFQP
ncbi:MAG TPA: hypothetical protein VMV18_01565, partial [bacterium]|nr:hypothetical protein [bacterium]